MTDSNRSARIQELEEEVRARAVDYRISDDFDDRMREAFLEQVLAFEDAPRATLRERLGDVPGDLWKLIARLAEMNIVLEYTNHLDDDSLMAYLLEFLEEPVAFPDLPGLVMHVDVIGTGSDEDIATYLRYYASDDDREDWQRQFPEYAMPPRAVPPFDRDRFLPKAHEEVAF